MSFEIEFEQEADWRWIAEIPEYFLSYSQYGHIR